MTDRLADDAGQTTVMCGTWSVMNHSTPVAMSSSAAAAAGLCAQSPALMTNTEHGGKPDALELSDYPVDPEAIYM